MSPVKKFAAILILSLGLVLALIQPATAVLRATRAPLATAPECECSCCAAAWRDASEMSARDPELTTKCVFRVNPPVRCSSSCQISDNVLSPSTSAEDVDTTRFCLSSCVPSDDLVGAACVPLTPEQLAAAVTPDGQASDHRLPAQKAYVGVPPPTEEAVAAVVRPTCDAACVDAKIRESRDAAKAAAERTLEAERVLRKKVQSGQ